MGRIIRVSLEEVDKFRRGIADPTSPRPDSFLEATPDYDTVVGDEMHTIIRAIAGGAPPPALSRLWGNCLALGTLGEKTKFLIQRLYERPPVDQDRVALYIFGEADGRKIHHLEPGCLAPARSLWPGSPSWRQNARALLDRIAPKVRAALLLELACKGKTGAFVGLLRHYAEDGWRTGTVGKLIAAAAEIGENAPEIAEAVSGVWQDVVEQAGDSKKCFEGSGYPETFQQFYNLLRFSALFNIGGEDVRSKLRSILSHNVSRVGTTRDYFIVRAVKRSLHLLETPEEWQGYIEELLHLAGDPSCSGRLFAAYEAFYYMDDASLTKVEDFPQLEEPKHEVWSAGLQAVLEQSDQNIDERAYRRPYQAAINALRVAVFFRSHPKLVGLTARQRKVVTRICRQTRYLSGGIDGRLRREVVPLIDDLERFGGPR
jgi:hypothetical protein